MAKKIILKLIKSYQKYLSFPEVISVLFMTPKNCRFYPSCSDYTHQAIKKHGVFQGTGLGIWRILRCQPFSKGGFDPIP